MSLNLIEWESAAHEVGVLPKNNHFVDGMVLLGITGTLMVGFTDDQGKFYSPYMNPYSAEMCPEEGDNCNCNWCWASRDPDDFLNNFRYDLPIENRELWQVYPEKPTVLY